MSGTVDTLAIPPPQCARTKGCLVSDDYLLRQILSELQKQTKLLKEIESAVNGVETAVYSTAD
jgi:hypothetical protein